MVGGLFGERVSTLQQQLACGHGECLLRCTATDGVRTRTVGGVVYVVYLGRPFHFSSSLLVGFFPRLVEVRLPTDENMCGSYIYPFFMAFFFPIVLSFAS